MHILAKLVIAIVIAVAVGLGLVGLLGPLLVTLKAPIAVTVGDFLINYGWVIGLLCGLWYFFAGGFIPRRGV